MFAIKRFDLFKRRVTNNLNSEAFCLKADIKHYFREVNHEILLEIISKRTKDKKVLLLIRRILDNIGNKGVIVRKGIPLGNLTSQFFANVYLNELDHFVKHSLKVKYYIRYVDDFVLLHYSCEQLEKWKIEIDNFLSNRLRINLHPDKSRIISLSKGIDFVGFRNYWHHRLLRKRNVRKMFIKIQKFKNQEMNNKKILESFCGWNAYARWENSYNLIKKVVKEIYKK